jgi:hypothetical protein
VGSPSKGTRSEGAKILGDTRGGLRASFGPWGPGCSALCCVEAYLWPDVRGGRQVGIGWLGSRIGLDQEAWGLLSRIGVSVRRRSTGSLGVRRAVARLRDRGRERDPRVTRSIGSPLPVGCFAWLAARSPLGWVFGPGRATSGGLPIRQRASALGLMRQMGRAEDRPSPRVWASVRIRQGRSVGKLRGDS